MKEKSTVPLLGCELLARLTRHEPTPSTMEWRNIAAVCPQAHLSLADPTCHRQVPPSISAT